MPFAQMQAASALFPWAGLALLALALITGAISVFSMPVGEPPSDDEDEWTFP